MSSQCPFPAAQPAPAVLSPPARPTWYFDNGIRTGWSPLAPIPSNCSMFLRLTRVPPLSLLLITALGLVVAVVCGRALLGARAVLRVGFRRMRAIVFDPAFRQRIEGTSLTSSAPVLSRHRPLRTPGTGHAETI